MICRSLLLSLPLIFTCHLSADDKNASWTDPAKAAVEDKDFAVQGEYAGEIAKAKVGVQLIAQGGGKFAAVYYPGGLPGDGFSGDKSKRLKGSATADQVTFPNLTGTLKDGKISFEGGTLAKVERKSPTLGAAAPAGAVVLFDGKSVDAFSGGKLDGDLLVQGVTTKQHFQNFTLHLEFKTPYMPAARGQGRGNSGCYLQGRYEVQVLDSFGLEGENNECGGVYTIKTPDVNMAFPPLTWQTYDIDYTAATFDANGKKTAHAKAVVKHNGVVIHTGVELTHTTTAAPVPEGPNPGPIYLQDHGNQVRYRNIWLVEKK